MRLVATKLQRRQHGSQVYFQTYQAQQVFEKKVGTVIAAKLARIRSVKSCKIAKRKLDGSGTY